MFIQTFRINCIIWALLLRYFRRKVNFFSLQLGSETVTSVILCLREVLISPHLQTLQTPVSPYDFIRAKGFCFWRNEKFLQSKFYYIPKDFGSPVLTSVSYIKHESRAKGFWLPPIFVKLDTRGVGLMFTSVRLTLDCLLVRRSKIISLFRHRR